MAASSYVVNISTSKYLATTTSAPPAFTGLATNRYYELTVSTDTYVAQSTLTPTAAAANGSIFVPAGKSILLDGGNGTSVSVLAASVAGVATLAPVTLVR